MDDSRSRRSTAYKWKNNFYRRRMLGKKFNWRGGLNQQGPRSSSRLGGDSYTSVDKVTGETTTGVHVPDGGDSTRFVIDQFLEQPKFSGWCLYFPAEVYSESSDAVRLVDLFVRFLIDQTTAYRAEEVLRTRRFMVDFRALKESVGEQECASVECQLKGNAERVVASMGLAMHHLISLDQEKQYHEVLRDLDVKPAKPLPPKVPKLHARFVNLEGNMPIADLKYSDYGKMVNVTAVVMKATSIAPRSFRIAFQCVVCSAVFVILLPDGVYTLPQRCVRPECRSRKFKPRLDLKKTETLDWQQIRVQDFSSASTSQDSGAQQKSVDCYLTDDLVGTVVPGNVVTLVAIVKARQIDEARKREEVQYKLYLAVNSITVRQGLFNILATVNEGGVDEMSIVKELMCDGNVFVRLVRSLCPSIYGQHMVKAGLLLALFGGSDSSSGPLAFGRSSIHVLIIGDPSLGKSNLLRACAALSPNGVYVCGGSTSVAGLTVAIGRNSSGDFALEAGALVTANDGCCCLDEFDKMSNQHQVLLEVMEQQQVSVYKAGVHCQFPAKTSILAAANPVHGHFDPALTIAENIRVNAPLLSRFDLTFLMLDEPDPEKDERVSEHVFDVRCRGSLSTDNFPRRHRESLVTAMSVVCSPSVAGANDELSFEERLRQGDEGCRGCSDGSRGSEEDEKDQEQRYLIPTRVLKRYIAFAREMIHPKITASACKVLLSFFEELSNSAECLDADDQPVGIRQMEALIRLVQAKARCELSDQISERHAMDVVDIVRYCIDKRKCAAANKSLGLATAARGRVRGRMSQKDHMTRFLKALHICAERKGSPVFTLAQLQETANEIHLETRHGFEHLLASLNNMGFLLVKGPKCYELNA